MLSSWALNTCRGGIALPSVFFIAEVRKGSLKLRSFIVLSALNSDGDTKN